MDAPATRSTYLENVCAASGLLHRPAFPTCRRGIPQRWPRRAPAAACRGRTRRRRNRHSHGITHGCSTDLGDDVLGTHAASYVRHHILSLDGGAPRGNPGNAHTTPYPYRSCPI